MFTRNDKVTGKHACAVRSLPVRADNQSSFIFCQDVGKSDAV